MNLPRLAPRRRLLAVALLAVALPAPLLATESEPDRFRKIRGKAPVIADPEMRALDRLVREGRGTGPRLRAHHEFLVTSAPYDRRPATGVRAKAVATHRAALAARDAQRAATGRTPFAEGSWRNLGPQNVPGRMTALVQDPRDANVLYAGSADGGVWKTLDAGATWSPTGDFAESLSIGALILDPAAPDTLWAGTGEGNFSSDRIPGVGVLKSTDGAATWTLSPLPEPWSKGIRRLDLDPADRKTIFAACDNGTLRSTDAGLTWSLVAELPSKSWDYATDVARDPGNPSIVYVAYGDVYGRNAAADSTPGIWRSTDRGATWALLGGGLPVANVGRIALSTSASAPGTLWAGIHRNTNDQLLGLYVSTDAGLSWTRKGATPNYCASQCWYDNVLAVDPADPNLVWAGGLDMYRSLDGGESWGQVSRWYLSPDDSRYVHADQHFILPKAGGEAWVASDGGVSRTVNKGAAWTFLGRGLVTTQYYSIASDGTGARLLGGLQDNGTILFEGTADWDDVYGGDGGFTAVDPVTPQNILTEYVFADVVRSTNGGTTWKNASGGISQNDRILFIAPFTMDPADPQRLLLGTNRVYLTVSQGQFWNAVSPNLTANPDSGYVSWASFDPTDPQSAWAGTTDGLVQVTRNLGSGAATWTNVASAPLPSRAVRSIAVDPSNGSRVFVSFSGYDSQTPDRPGHVFRTTDGGATWRNVSKGLPDHPARSVVVDPDDPRRVYLGTDLGVYGSVDGGDSWVPLGDAFPFASVHQLVLDRSRRVLVAATHGRGAWEIDLPLEDAPLVAVIPVATHAPGANGTFYVTDLRVVNAGAADATAELSFAPAGASRPPETTVTIDVPAGATKRLDDVVLGTFGVAEGFGRVVVRSASKLLVSARTYNAAATGTFGQYEPAALPTDTTRFGAPPLRLLGITRSADFRTNLGLVEASGRAGVAVRVTVRDDAGSVVGLLTTELSAGGMVQVPDIPGAAGVPAEVTRMRLEVSVTGGGTLAAYASVVDNRSGDAVFVPGRPSPVNGGVQIVPGVARAAGANGSFWRTDLDLENPLGVARTVDLAFLREGADGTAAPEVTVELAPYESRRLEDVVGTLFATEGAGAIRVETPATQAGLLVTGRTYTVDAGGASYGQFVAARGAVDALGAGRTQLLAGLGSTANFRTNAGFVNASASAARVSWTIVDPAGVAWPGGTVDVAPWSQTTVGDLHVDAPSGGRLDLPEARVVFGADGGAVIGWMSVVDNRTNDPVLVPSVEP